MLYANSDVSITKFLKATALIQGTKIWLMRRGAPAIKIARQDIAAATCDFSDFSATILI